MVGESYFAMNEDLFCTSHLEKCVGWMVMGQVRKFFEKTEGLERFLQTQECFLQT